jgi:predicted nucleic acid-binding protein
MPDRVVIADTSCLISLTRIDQLELLNSLYKEVNITKEIALEFGEPLPPWVKVVGVKDAHYMKLLQNQLDLGEASALALGLELGDVLLILDDLKGRKEAMRLGFDVTGTLGILLKAKQKGLLTSVRHQIEKLTAMGFRVSPRVQEQLLRLSEE